MTRLPRVWPLAMAVLMAASCATPGPRSTKAYLEGGDDPEAEAGPYHAELHEENLDKIRQGLAQIVSYLEAHPDRYFADGQYDLRLYGMIVSYKIIEGLRTVRVAGPGIDVIDVGCDGFQPGRDTLHGVRRDMPLTEREVMGVNARYARVVVAVVQRLQPGKSGVNTR